MIGSYSDSYSLQYQNMFRTRKCAFHIVIFGCTYREKASKMKLETINNVDVSQKCFIPLSKLWLQKCKRLKEKRSECLSKTVFSRAGRCQQGIGMETLSTFLSWRLDYKLLRAVLRQSCKMSHIWQIYLCKVFEDLLGLKSLRVTYARLTLGKQPISFGPFDHLYRV